jgi:hypothetical protein
MKPSVFFQFEVTHDRIKLVRGWVFGFFRLKIVNFAQSIIFNSCSMFGIMNNE